MEKTTSLGSAGGSLGLLRRLGRKKDRLLGLLLPGWADSKIENLLFVHNAKPTRPVRIPRGFRRLDIRSAQGSIRAYETGNGPTVVFVHGWGGGASQFFPLMHGLAQCGFRSIAFDQLGHGGSESRPATLQQTIATTNQVLDKVRRSRDGLCAIVGHSTGCIAIAAARNALVRDLPLFLISPVFNYKLFFLKKLVKLQLHPAVLKKYANGFARAYRGEFRKLELARNLERYGDCTVIAHEESDGESAIADSIAFCDRHPLTRLLVTRHCDHLRIINSETVWQQLKSHLNYDDTSINFTAEVIYD
jgi:pimeloyl-ACP methyl ester carboxylesterase